VSAFYIFISTKTTVPTIVPPYSRNAADLNRRISNSSRANAGGHLTVGDLKLRPISNAIPNHLLCNGAAVSRVQFPELFALLGITEGAGDGATTFNLPNYGGQALTASVATQTVSASGTVADGTVATEPDAPGEIGGTRGGDVVSGGRVAPDRLVP